MHELGSDPLHRDRRRARVDAVRQEHVDTLADPD
jgi:hypothetical protein